MKWWGGRSAAAAGDRHRLHNRHRTRKEEPSPRALRTHVLVCVGASIIAIIESMMVADIL
jgi:hypothetical protein